MDIPGVAEHWELEVNPLMQEMHAAHREDDYFNPQEHFPTKPSKTSSPFRTRVLLGEIVDYPHETTERSDYPSLLATGPLPTMMVPCWAQQFLEPRAVRYRNHSGSSMFQQLYFY
ncbi:acetyl-CoA carboxylase subunit beta [Anopheles sinensis]|uniref:Acetyl-CoA carboxylase subunit beta n=1 Tax=Anopheles sinensis TaxID=74873 RepID=A0A084WDU6_ANOSI|nr:acetyl-CoA carboxylase subunit beta [Anopheles sinensis]